MIRVGEYEFDDWHEGEAGWSRVVPEVDCNTGIFIDCLLDEYEVVLVGFWGCNKLANLWASETNIQPSSDPSIFYYPKNTDWEKLKTDIDQFLQRVSQLDAFV